MPVARDSVIVADVGSRWAVFGPTAWTRLLTRWRADALDAQLATGKPPEGDRHRAMRATALVAPESRRELAACWQRVLERATRTPDLIDSRVPLQRTAVLAAAENIRELIAALRVAAPVPARGVAIAHRLLRDGLGPLYNSRSRTDLRATVCAAIRHLDPLVEVVD
jgi:hypothetical protein